MRYPPTCWRNIRNHFTGARRESKRSKAIPVYPQTYVGSIDKRRNVTNMILPSFEEHNAIFSGINTLTFRCKLPQPYLDMSTLPSWRWRKEILMKSWRISTKNIQCHVPEDGSLHIPHQEKPQILLSSFVSGSFNFPFSDIVPLQNEFRRNTSIWFNFYV